MAWEEVWQDKVFLGSFFLYFSPSERLGMSQVCQRWRQVLYQPQFWREVRPVLHCRTIRSWSAGSSSSASCRSRTRDMPCADPSTGGSPPLVRSLPSRWHQRPPSRSSRGRSEYRPSLLGQFHRSPTLLARRGCAWRTPSAAPTRARRSQRAARRRPRRRRGRAVRSAGRPPPLGRRGRPESSHWVHCVSFVTHPIPTIILILCRRCFHAFVFGDFVSAIVGFVEVVIDMAAPLLRFDAVEQGCDVFSLHNIRNRGFPQ